VLFIAHLLFDITQTINTLQLTN